MKELRRILLNPRFLVCLLLCLIVNIVLFQFQQYGSDLGLDLRAGNVSATIATDEMVAVSNAKPDLDVRACYSIYTNWLNRYKDVDPSFAEAELAEKENGLRSMRAEEITPEIQMDLIATQKLRTQLRYLCGFKDYLQGIQGKRDHLMGFSIFNQKDTFAYRNVIKTADEFEILQDVTLSLGADDPVNSLMKFQLTDYFILILLVLVCLSFIEERKAGLWASVQAARHGRLILALRRIIALFIASAGMVCLFYGANLFSAFALYGGLPDFGRAAQSAEIFAGFPIAVSIGGLLLHFFALRITSFFFVGLLIWALVSVVKNIKVSLFVLTVFLASEYSFYAFLPVQSGLNIFKYLNIFTYVNGGILYTKYLNIDIFGYPIDIRTISAGALPLLCVITCTACVLTSCRKKPIVGREVFGRIAIKTNSLFDFILRRLPLFELECYKFLVIGRGAVVLALLVYVAAGLNYVQPIPPETQEKAISLSYINQLEGRINEQTYTRIETIQSEIERVFSEYETAKTQFDSGKIDYAQFDVYKRQYAVAGTQNRALQDVRNIAKSAKLSAEENNIPAWIVNDMPYRAVYGLETEGLQQRTAILALIAIAFLVSGVFSYETQSGMNKLLVSTAKGRKKLFWCKALYVAFVTGFVWAVVYGFEFYAFAKTYNPQTLNAPIRSLALFANFSIKCNVGVFLILLNLFRFIMLYCVASIAMFITAKIKRTDAALLAAAGTLVLPSALYTFMGIPMLRYASISVPISGTGLLLSKNGGMGFIMGIGVVVIVGVVAITIKMLKTRAALRIKQSG